MWPIELRRLYIVRGDLNYLIGEKCSLTRVRLAVSMSTVQGFSHRA